MSGRRTKATEVEETDEADRVRERVIARLERQNMILLVVLVVGSLTAILGGPMTLQALAAVQGFVGMASGAP